MFDRPKTVALKWQRNGEVTEWNPAFAYAMLEMGVGVELCWPQSPEQKGAVENLVGFVKSSFFKVRRFHDQEDLEQQLLAFEVAQQLVAAGQEVALLALIGSPFPTMFGRASLMWVRLSSYAKALTPGAFARRLQLRLERQRAQAVVGSAALSAANFLFNQEPTTTNAGTMTIAWSVSGSVELTETATAVTVSDDPPACTNQLCVPVESAFIITGVQMHAPAGMDRI